MINPESFKIIKGNSGQEKKEGRSVDNSRRNSVKFIYLGIRLIRMVNTVVK